VEAGSSQSGGVTATVPANTPLGFYNLLVCADDGNVIVENDETNNSVLGNVLQETLPDLVETAVSEPPRPRRSSPILPETGVLVAPASTTRYYLSKDGRKGRGTPSSRARARSPR
jgi:hypothetical protein